MAQMSEKKMMMVIALSGIALTGCAIGGVYWARGRIQEEKVKIRDLEGQIAQAEAKKARIPQDEKEVIILRENVSEYVKILPESKELTTFMKTVNAFVRNSGVFLQRAVPKPAGFDPKSAFSKYSYQLIFRGNIWQILKFMHSFETYKRFVSIRDFRLTAGKPASEGYVELVPHQVDMTVETYTYNQAAGGKPPVTIAKYNTKRDYLSEEIYLARKKIEMEKYSFHGSRRRRDIFVDPRMRPDVLGGDVEAQKKLIQDLGQKIQKLTERLKMAKKEEVKIIWWEEKRKIEKELATIRKNIEEIQENHIISFQPLELSFQNEVLEPMEWLAKELGGEGEDPQKRPGIRQWSMQELQEGKSAMEQALIEGYIEKAMDRFEMMEVEGFNFAPGDPRVSIVARLRELYRFATTALEFQNLTIRILGAIVVEEGNSTAIINRRTYQEGDAIDNDLYLKEIRREELVFIFKGVEIMKRW